jgi:hypothetical protein
MSVLLTILELDKLYESGKKRAKEPVWIFVGKAKVQPWSTYSGRSFEIEDPIYVRGSTEQQALTRIKGAIRNANNLPEYVPLALFEYEIQEWPEDIERPECAECGILLNSAGECPICDLGEKRTDYYSDNRKV